MEKNHKYFHLILEKKEGKKPDPLKGVLGPSLAGKRPETDQNFDLDVSSQKWDLKDSRLVGSRWKQQNSTEVGGAGPPETLGPRLIRPLITPLSGPY